MTYPATLRDVLHQTTLVLRDAGFDEPQREARRLIASACGLKPEDFILRPDLRLDAGQTKCLDGFTKRRCNGEPLSRIVGRREFYGREFELGPATLDPRPDTETVIEMALEIVDREGWRTRQLRILDVGTGSGALLVTLLSELANARGLATDISEDALAIARRNCVNHGVSDRTEFATANALDGIEGPFDILVSNPPYIPTTDIEGLSPSVRNFDPRAALDGGFDGLDIYRKIIARACDVVPKGWVVFEVGAGQAGAVADLLRLAVPGAGKIPRIETRQDLGGHIRCVAAVTHCS
ncbi:MAG: peptide chain release factor N(5)-glutamine methyltransferase [Hyphomicrobiaceae bacterium]